MSSAVSLLAEKIDAGDAEVALALVKSVGVEHLVEAATPGPVTPLGVHARLATQVNADLANELFVDVTVSDLVEKRSDDSFG
jgi:hypothetical protein